MSFIHLKLILCRAITRGLTSLFYMWTSDFPSTICWRYCLSSTGCFWHPINGSYVHLPFGSSTCLCHCHVVLFLVSVVFYLLSWFFNYHSNITWDLEWQSLQQCSFCSGLLLLPGVFCGLRIFFYFYEWWSCFYWNFIQSVHCFCWSDHVHNINFTNRHYRKSFHPLVSSLISSEI